MGHANFHNPLTLDPDGLTVDAWGPNDWEPGDAWMEVSAVTITQGDVVAWSEGTKNVDITEENWWLKATSDRPLRTGHATAEAIAIIHSQDGDVVRYPWSERVWLEEAPEAPERETRSRKKDYATARRRRRT
jgi:hypothetical protein